MSTLNTIGTTSPYTFRGKSFGQILDANNGAGLGFDILRFGLALAILLSHASGLAGTQGFTSGLLASIFHIGSGTEAILPSLAKPATLGADTHAVTGLARPFTLSHVPMFFALSGFLVAGSAFRTRNLVKFLGLRVIRIVPALFVEVFLSAIIIGGIFTTLPLDAYFSHPAFYSYFLNIVGDVHMTLPGVFERSGTLTAVNANLWTLPSEFECYLITTIAIGSTILFRPQLMSILFIAVTAILLIASIGFGYQNTDETLPGPVIVYYFFVGLMFYIWRHRIIFHEAIFLLVGTITWILMMFTSTVFIYPILLTYVTIFIGLYPFPQFKLLKSGDYSYGIYLYGYPVTQALLASLPALRNNLPATAFCSVALTLLFAAFSWHAVEKHALKLKVLFSRKSSQIAKTLHTGVSDERTSTENA